MRSEVFRACSRLARLTSLAFDFVEEIVRPCPCSLESVEKGGIKGVGFFGHRMAVSQASPLADGPIEPMGVPCPSSPGVALA